MSEGIVNKRFWQKLLNEQQAFTLPWLHLERPLLERYARAQVKDPAEPLIHMYPCSVLAGVAGRNVLCLASGGGQQSAVFGILGARVTVVDLVKGQLDGDRKAAAHYGYEVVTIQADMRDLACLANESYDLVYQAPSLAYVPDVGCVFSEVARVLKVGGTYRFEATNPATQFVDESWDEGYRIVQPYAVKKLRRADGAIEFRHYLSDIFNGLIENGLSIRHVCEAPCHLGNSPSAKPGAWEHRLAHIPWLFTIVATKQRGES